MDGAGRNESTRALGAALRNRRLAQGMSLRALAKRVGLTAHGTLVDYEHGRRIPPEDLIVACEKVLEVDDGSLRRLRVAALAERAGQQSALLLASSGGGGTRAPEDAPVRAVVTRPARGWWRRWPALVAVLALLAAGLTAAAFRPGGGHGTLRFGFESPQDRWSILWGSQAASGRVTDSLAYEGAHSYEVSITGASAKGYVAFGTTHGLRSLHSGMRVTMHLWTSYPSNGVRFFVYDPVSRPVWAPETPGNGSEVPISGGTRWTTVTWTVPPVSEVAGIGIQPYAENDVPRVVAVDAVSW
jgi:transcriptional regulator with XRE-family HTH domain